MGWGTGTVPKGDGGKGKCLQGWKVPVFSRDKQPDTQGAVGDASQLLLGLGFAADPLRLGREEEEARRRN